MHVLAEIRYVEQNEVPEALERENTDRSRRGSASTSA
jgi:hypothetical protein